MRKFLLLPILSMVFAQAFSFSEKDYVNYAYRFDDLETGTQFPVVSETGDTLADATAVVELKAGSATDKVLHVRTGAKAGMVIMTNPDNMTAAALLKKYSVLSVRIMNAAESTASSIFNIFFGVGNSYNAYKDKAAVAFPSGQWKSMMYSPLSLAKNSLKKEMRLGLLSAGMDYYMDDICFLSSKDAFEKVKIAREQAIRDSILAVQLAKSDSIMAAEKEAAERLFPEYNNSMDKTWAYDFEDYAAGTEFPVYADGSSTEPLAEAKAVVEADPKNSRNKVLHIYGASSVCYVELDNPDGLSAANLLKKYKDMSIKLMRSASGSLTKDSKFQVMWGGNYAYNKALKTAMTDAGKWYTETVPLALSKNSLKKMMRIGFADAGADYYIDNICFLGTEYDPTFADKTKTVRYWADKMGKNFGTCLNQWSAGSLGNLAGNNFNMVVCENEMKFDATEPNRNQFSYNGGQTIVNTAKNYGMKVRGHTLTWHGQNPDWVTNFKGSRKDWEGILKNHIYNVVGHWKGQIAEWDVVNECLEENNGRAVGAGYSTRTWSVWYQGFGDDSYIDSAFVWAHQADPDAKLYINDYNIGHWGGGHYENGKTHAMYNLAKRLKDAGIPIDGVGMQTHTSVSGMQPEQIEETVKQFRAIGLNCIITEMDMPGGETGQQGDKTVCTRPISDAELQTQAEKYAALADIMVRYDNCPTMVVWGVTDNNSWLDGSEGTKPLLFFADNTPHPAYIEIRKTYQRWSLLRTDVGEIMDDDYSNPMWVGDDSQSLDVYNLSGQKIAEGIDMEQVLQLPAGFYIVGGKKFIIR